MRYLKLLVLFLLCFVLFSGCNVFNKTMTECEYRDFTENEITKWGLIIEIQSEYNDILIESTNEAADFYGNSYADSEIVFSYLTKIKEHQEVVRELIKARESINPPEKYKESNQKFLQALKKTCFNYLETKKI